MTCVCGNLSVAVLLQTQLGRHKCSSGRSVSEAAQRFRNLCVRIQHSSKETLWFSEEALEKRSEHWHHFFDTYHKIDWVLCFCYSYMPIANDTYTNACTYNEPTVPALCLGTLVPRQKFTSRGVKWLWVWE